MSETEFRDAYKADVQRRYGVDRGIIWNSVRRSWNLLVSAILDAQKAVGPAEVPGDQCQVQSLAPALASPDLVGALVARDQYDEHTIATRPIRSTTADAKRAALRYAEERAGRPLTWKAARKLLSQWERLERGVSA